MKLKKSSGKVLDLRMSEGNGSTAYDVSRYGNDGAVNGDVVWTDHGMRFDGSTGYLDCGNDESLNISDAITLSVWMMPATIQTDWACILGQGDASYSILRNSTHGKWHGLIKTSIGDSRVYDNVIASSYDGGTWVNFVLSFNGANTILYKNGISIDTDNSATGNINNPTTSVLIGKLDSGFRFDGSIDQPRIHSRALTAREIMKYYEATKHKYV